MSSSLTDSQLRRRRIPFPQRVVIAPRDGSQPHAGKIFDLSLGGLFIETYLPLEIGEVFDFQTTMDSFRFQAAARVLWIRGSEQDEGQPSGMAAEFVNLNTAQKRIIHRQITYHTQMGGDLRVGTPPRSGKGSKPSRPRLKGNGKPAKHSLWSRLTSNFLR